MHLSMHYPVSHNCYMQFTVLGAWAAVQANVFVTLLKQKKQNQQQVPGLLCMPTYSSQFWNKRNEINNQGLSWGHNTKQLGEWCPYTPQGKNLGEKLRKKTFLRGKSPWEKSNQKQLNSHTYYKVNKCYCAQIKDRKTENNTPNRTYPGPHLLCFAWIWDIWN